jgi:tetratricopeptide (TPR) repeat protein
MVKSVPGSVVDPVSASVIGWLTGQALTAGQAKLVRLLRGDRQQNALRKIIQASIGPAVTEVVSTADRDLIEEALLREGPDSVMPETGDVASLRGLVSRVVSLRLAVLTEQGYHVDADRLSAVLAGRIAVGIQADAAHNGTLGPVADWLRHQETIGELRGVNQRFEKVLSQPTQASVYVHNPTESAVAAVHTLPADNISFTGRSAELSRIPAAAAPGGAAGIVTIDGMAGVGKTSFAVHVAHQIAAGFPDGQFFIRLHGHTPGQPPTEPAAALAALLGNLGISAQQIPPGIEERAGLWRDRMAGKRVLLVLDDATGSDQIRPLLPGTAGTLVLITSRRRLTALPEALAITLGILEPAEAARLLVLLAGRDGLEASDTSVSAVVRLCGYLPLAISLTAGNLKHHPAWTVTDLVDDLDSAKNRIVAIRAEDVSVAAAFDLSYRELSDSQKRLFRRLGLVPGPDIDAFAAAALDDQELVTASRLLDDLYVAHLVDEPARGRYRMHDLIREHAVALADTDDRTERAAAMNRLLDYYAHTARTADRHLARRSHTSVPVTITMPPAYSPDLSTPSRAASWMQAERANLHAAARHAAHQDKPGHATAIAVSMHGFLRTYGYWDQAFELHNTAISAARRDVDRLGEAESLNNLGVIQRLTQDYPGAGASLTRAMELYHELDNPLGEANALNYLGVIQRLTKAYAQAKESFTRALGIYSDLDDLIGQANALNYLGVLQQATGEFPDAAVSQQRALSLYHLLDDKLGEANALLGLGVVQQSMSEYLPAAGSLRQALSLYQEIDSRLGQANALKYLGHVQQLSGDYPAASISLRQAFSLYQELGNHRGQADALKYLKSIQ